MRKVCAIILLVSCFSIILSCDKYESDYFTAYEKYGGSYKGTESNTGSGIPSCTYYHVNDTDLVIAPGKTDSTIIIYNFEVHPKTDGSFGLGGIYGRFVKDSL